MERVAVYGAYRVMHNRRGTHRVDETPNYIVAQRDGKAFVSRSQWVLGKVSSDG